MGLVLPETYEELLQRGGGGIYPIPRRRIANKQLVYYDLETTGLDNPRRITQIGAVADSNGEEFCCYVCPTVRIQRVATFRHNLANQHGRLVNRATRQECEPHAAINEALQEFNNFLGNVRRDNGGREIILIGHNIAHYDNGILIDEAANAGRLGDLNQRVYGYIDTKHAFMRWDWMEGRNRGWGGYKQRALARDFIGPNHVQAHEAVSDARDLRKIVENAGLNNGDILSDYIRLW